jgi:acyl carrier protein
MDRKELAAVVLELLEKETGETYTSLDDSTSLREGLNLDSLDMAGLVLHIENHFGISIETELLEQITTVGALLDTLHNKLVAKTAKKAA